MSSNESITTSKAGLLTYSGERETVLVKNTSTGTTERARVDDTGIVRDVDSTAAYGSGAYEAIDIDPTRLVLVSKHNTRSRYHTSQCRSVKRTDNRNRSLIPVQLAIGFYDVDECPYCSKKDRLDESELEQYAGHVHDNPR